MKHDYHVLKIYTQNFLEGSPDVNKHEACFIANDGYIQAARESPCFHNIQYLIVLCIRPLVGQAVSGRGENELDLEGHNGRPRKQTETFVLISLGRSLGSGYDPVHVRRP